MKVTQFEQLKDWQTCLASNGCPWTLAWTWTLAMTETRMKFAGETLRRARYIILITISLSHHKLDHAILVTSLKGDLIQVWWSHLKITYIFRFALFVGIIQSLWLHVHMVKIMRKYQSWGEDQIRLIKLNINPIIYYMFQLSWYSGVWSKPLRWVCIRGISSTQKTEIRDFSVGSWFYCTYKFYIGSCYSSQYSQYP